MAQIKNELEINLNTKSAIRKINAANRAAKKLQKALDKLRKIEIGIIVFHRE